MTTRYTPVRDLPAWARLAIERLQLDRSLRTVETFHDLCAAYAATYGQDAPYSVRLAAEETATQLGIL